MMDRWIVYWVDGKMGRIMDGWIVGLVGKWGDGWMMGWMDRWMSGWMGRWVDNEFISQCEGEEDKWFVRIKGTLYQRK